MLYNNFCLKAAAETTVEEMHMDVENEHLMNWKRTIVMLGQFISTYKSNST